MISTSLQPSLGPHPSYPRRQKHVGSKTSPWLFSRHDSSNQHYSYQHNQHVLQGLHLVFAVHPPNFYQLWPLRRSALKALVFRFEGSTTARSNVDLLIGLCRHNLPGTPCAESPNPSFLLPLLYLRWPIYFSMWRRLRCSISSAW